MVRIENMKKNLFSTMFVQANLCACLQTYMSIKNDVRPLISSSIKLYFIYVNKMYSTPDKTILL